jgi:hypothetical protein
VTNTGKAFFLAGDSRSRLQIVKEEGLTITASIHSPRVQFDFQQFFLMLANSLMI